VPVVLLWLTVILQLTGHATCLAVTTSSSTPQASKSDRITSVVSNKKSGGHSKTFSFHDAKTESDVTATTMKQQRKQKKKLDDVRSLANNIQSGLRSTFLPSGFPVRTPAGYLQYSVWSWIQDLSTQLRAVLATQRVLEGVGVGREGATALSALMNFLVRDGCGIVGYSYDMRSPFILWMDLNRAASLFDLQYKTVNSSFRYFFKAGTRAT
jgi:hypothetical protein